MLLVLAASDGVSKVTFSAEKDMSSPFTILTTRAPFLELSLTTTVKMCIRDRGLYVFRGKSHLYYLHKI